MKVTLFLHWWGYNFRKVFPVKKINELFFNLFLMISKEPTNSSEIMTARLLPRLSSERVTRIFSQPYSTIILILHLLVNISWIWFYHPNHLIPVVGFLRFLLYCKFRDGGSHVGWRWLRTISSYRLVLSSMFSQWVRWNREAGITLLCRGKIPFVWKVKATAKFLLKKLGNNLVHEKFPQWY